MIIYYLYIRPCTDTIISYILVYDFTATTNKRCKYFWEN